jgi:hypothetical protein
VEQSAQSSVLLVTVRLLVRRAPAPLTGHAGQGDGLAGRPERRPRLSSGSAPAATGTGSIASGASGATLGVGHHAHRGGGDRRPPAVTCAAVGAAPRRCSGPRAVGVAYYHGRVSSAWSVVAVPWGILRHVDRPRVPGIPVADQETERDGTSPQLEQEIAGPPGRTRCLRQPSWSHATPPEAASSRVAELLEPVQPVLLALFRVAGRSSLADAVPQRLL